MGVLHDPPVLQPTVKLKLTAASSEHTCESYCCTNSDQVWTHVASGVHATIVVSVMPPETQCVMLLLVTDGIEAPVSLYPAEVTVVIVVVDVYGRADDVSD